MADGEWSRGGQILILNGRRRGRHRRRRPPSVACGLGRAPVSAKGWVLAMLARKGELRVALVPRRLVGPPRRWSGFASAGSGPRRAFLSARLARPRKTAPEGEDAGIGPASPPGSERDQIMSTPSKSATRNQTVRHTITFELVQRHAPNAGLAENLSRTFGLDPVDYAAILERTEEHIALSAQALQDH